MIILTCDHCQFETQHQNQLDKHKRTEHEVQKFPCGSCSYKAIHSKDLLRHNNTMHGTPYKCSKCDFESIYQEAIYDHIRQEHRNTRNFFSSNSNSRNNPDNLDRLRKGFKSNPFPSSSSSTHSASIPTYASSSTVPQASSLFHCKVASCSSRIKSFKHEDELKLHMMFYHEETKQ